MGIRRSAGSGAALRELVHEGDEVVDVQGAVRLGVGEGIAHGELVDEADEVDDVEAAIGVAVGGAGGEAAADEEVVALGPGIVRPVKLSGASPDLQEFRVAPPLIIIESTVGTDGRLRDMSFRPADLDPRIVERLQQTLSTWRFEPARKDGRPVAVRYTLTLNIHLQ